LELVLAPLEQLTNSSGDKWPPIAISLIEAQARDLGPMSDNPDFANEAIEGKGRDGCRFQANSFARIQAFSNSSALAGRLAGRNEISSALHAAQSLRI
jgi:hypothetical protein